MRRTLLGLTLSAALVPTALAAEVDPYLPADAEAVLSVNVEQLVKTPLGKKTLAPYLLKQINKDARAAAFLKAAGIDPMTDFKRVNLAGTVSGLTNQELLFASVHGKFDPAKIQAAAAKAAEADKEHVKIHKDGDATIYELDGERTLYVAVASESVVLYGSSKKTVTDALARTGKSPVLKKNLADLLGKADDSASVFLAADTTGASGQLPVQLEDAQKKAVDSMHAITGTVAVDTDVKIELAMHTKDAESAKALNELLEDALGQAKGFLQFLAGANAQMKPVIDLLNSIKNGAKDKSVRVTGEVPGAALEKALNNPKDN